ncbi:hypothetical protein K3495_g2492 [Podosphaera aphanis]|nr:hypothetical protein K3495_g2492 [Podosphaera aphanis]
MRSFTLISIFALALSSVSATAPAGTLDMQTNNPSSTDQSASGYACRRNYYIMAQVNKTVKKACKEIKKGHFIKRAYPKVYEPKDQEARFEGIQGNQYIFPIFKRRMYSSLLKTHHDRVVVSWNNDSCCLVGLVREKPGFKSSLKKTFGRQIEFTKCRALLTGE